MITARRLQRLSLLLAVLWAAGLFYLSHQPDPAFHPSYRHEDKIVHFMAFAILGLLGLGSMPVHAYGYRPAQAWLVVLLAGLYGILDEVHQSFIPGRVADGLDAAADFAGALFGAWLLYFLARLAARHRSAETGRLDPGRSQGSRRQR